MKLAENGKTGYSIIIGTEVTEAEQYAAVELANFLKQVTGAVFPVTNKDIYKEKENKELFINILSIILKLMENDNTNRPSCV